MFCEMHSFKDIGNNFKWVSTFNTALKVMLNSVNWDHWRFQISDMWDQIRGFDAHSNDKTPW